jgi:hypothetical protein
MIFEAADVGVEYWMGKRNPKVDSATTDKIRLIEAKVDGFQTKINLFASLVRSRVRVKAAEKLSSLIADFFDALTGGSFGAELRARDQARARLVYTTAADLVAHLRSTKPKPSWIPIMTVAAIFAATILAIVFLLPDIASGSSSGIKWHLFCTQDCAKPSGTLLPHPTR